MVVCVAGAIWSNQMPERLAHYLPQLSDKERHELFGSVEKAAERPRGDPVREGVILGVFPFLLLFIPVFFLHPCFLPSSLIFLLPPSLPSLPHPRPTWDLDSD